MQDNKYGFQGFVHSTSFENFINIMKENFIYSRNYLDENKISSQDIALIDVIEKTADEVKNYVRCYWRVKTPTNYDNEGIKPKDALKGNYEAHSPNPVIIILDKNLALDKNVRFSPINAGSQNSKLYKNLNDEFTWEDIFHNGIIYDEDKKIITLRKNAEFLYPIKISIEKIEKIIFRNKADYDRAILILGYKDKRFSIDENQFYNNWLKISNYEYSIENNEIELKISFNIGQQMKKGKFNLTDFSHNIKFLDNNEQMISNHIIEYNKYDNNKQIKIKMNHEDKILCYYIDDIECIRIKIND